MKASSKTLPDYSKVVHGRRQFVPQGVLLSQITNETPVLIC